MKPTLKPSASASNKPGFLLVAPWAVESQGGVNGVIRHLVEEMKHDDAYNPILLENNWRNRRPIQRANDLCTTVAMRLRGLPSGGTPWYHWVTASISYLITLPVVLYRLRRLIRNNNIRYINIQYPGSMMFSFTLLRRLGLFDGTIIISLHNSDLREGLNLTGLAGKTWRRLLHDADGIITVSKQLRAQLVDSMDNLADKTHVAYNGVDPDFFLPAYNNADTRLQKPKTLLCLASFDFRKGVDVLLHAFAQIIASQPDIRLLIVGQSGNDDEALFQISTDLGLDDQVTWRRDVDYHEIVDVLAQADVFVLPSRNEGFPLALLEAGAMGLPVVATAVGGTPELIRHQKNGLLVPPDNTESLAKALDYMIKNPVQAAELGHELQEIVSTKFSWRAMYDRYVDVFQICDNITSQQLNR